LRGIAFAPPIGQLERLLTMPSGDPLAEMDPGVKAGKRRQTGRRLLTEEPANRSLIFGRGRQEEPERTLCDGIGEHIGELRQVLVGNDRKDAVFACLGDQLGELLTRHTRVC
jgi:hypothetical protein